VRVARAERKTGRVRRNALRPDSNFPDEKLSKFIHSYKLDENNTPQLLRSPK